jgi:hypothetical protein
VTWCGSSCTRTRCAADADVPTCNGQRLADDSFLTEKKGSDRWAPDDVTRPRDVERHVGFHDLAQRPGDPRPRGRASRHLRSESRDVRGTQQKTSVNHGRAGRRSARASSWSHARRRTRAASLRLGNRRRAAEAACSGWPAGWGRGCVWSPLATARVAPDRAGARRTGAFRLRPPAHPASHQPQPAASIRPRRARFFPEAIYRAPLLRVQ